MRSGSNAMPPIIATAKYRGKESILGRDSVQATLTSADRCAITTPSKHTKTYAINADDTYAQRIRWKRRGLTMSSACKCKLTPNACSTLAEIEGVRLEKLSRSQKKSTSDPKIIEMTAAVLGKRTPSGKIM